MYLPFVFKFHVLIKRHISMLVRKPATVPFPKHFILYLPSIPLR